MSETTEPRILYVGLGNPGKNYANTKHNIGFMVLEELAKSLGLTWQENQKFNAKTAKGSVNNRPVDLMMPLTFMNLSGTAVKQFLDYYKMDASQLIVVCDDAALPYGHLRARSQGSSGGQNGLKSIISSLGTQEFARLRMGIGEARPGQDLADYVLSGFDAKEKTSLDEFIKRGATVLKALSVEPITTVMNDIKLCRPET